MLRIRLKIKIRSHRYARIRGGGARSRRLIISDVARTGTENPLYLYNESQNSERLAHRDERIGIA